MGAARTRRGRAGAGAAWAITWSEVKNAVQSFVFLKASEGQTRVATVKSTKLGTASATSPLAAFAFELRKVRPPAPRS